MHLRGVPGGGGGGDGAVADPAGEALATKVGRGVIVVLLLLPPPPPPPNQNILSCILSLSLFLATLFSPLGDDGR